MAGDWIKMRTSLLTNPKVNGIAKFLEEDRAVSQSLTTGFNGYMSELVTRNVMRHVTVSLLLIVWGAANEHTRDGVFHNSDLSDIDDMVGVPGFGEAMQSVGWAKYEAEFGSVTLPNFNEYNTSGQQRTATAKSAAERQREYRERKKSQQSDVTRDVTNDVTSNRREEKRREEENPLTPKGGASRFEDFWNAWPKSERKQDKVKCAKKWRTSGLDSQADEILADIAIKQQTQKWLGGYIEAPLVYLNGARWNDGVTPEDGANGSRSPSNALAGAI